MFVLRDWMLPCRRGQKGSKSRGRRSRLRWHRYVRDFACHHSEQGRLRTIPRRACCRDRRRATESAPMRGQATPKGCCYTPKQAQDSPPDICLRPTHSLPPETQTSEKSARYSISNDGGTREHGATGLAPFCQTPTCRHRGRNKLVSCAAQRPNSQLSNPNHAQSAPRAWLPGTYLARRSRFAADRAGTARDYSFDAQS